MLELARPIGDLQVLVPALASAGLVKSTQGHLQEALALIAELDDLTSEHHRYRARELPTAIRILTSADQLDEADELLAGMVVSAVRDQHSLLTAHAIVAEARDEIGQARDFYQQAAQGWADYGFVFEEGQAHLGLARCLFALGEKGAATELLQKARAIFSRLGAVPLINETDTYLDQAQAAS